MSYENERYGRCVGSKRYRKRAHDWGHPAIAITDHGVAQAFPDANHYIETLDKDDPFKVLYGVEGYVVDDLTEIAVNAGNQTLDDTYIVFDIETTGFSSIKDAIIEVGAVKVTDGKITDRFSTFVNPKRPIPFEITNPDKHHRRNGDGFTDNRRCFTSVP